MDASRSKLNERLRQQRLLRGWTQEQAADKLYKLCGSKGSSRGDINANMVSRWENGKHPPSPFWQSKLCELYEKSTEELGLLITSQSLHHTWGTNLTRQDLNTDTHKWGITHSMIPDNMTQGPFVFEESNSCFSFGKLKTTWTVLDGNGMAEYTPDTLHCHYDSTPENIAPEIDEEKERIQKKQAQNKKDGKPFQWNGLKYNLFKILISREPEEENMTLDLWFRPTDYYTSLATYKMLDNPDFRKKYFPEEDWLFPSPHFVNSIGTNLTVLTSDNHVILTQRSATQGVRPQMFSNSVSESVSRPQDKGATSLAPDLYRCACRGLFEELGLREGYDFVCDHILFLCFGTDTQYGLYGPRGMVKVQRTSSEVLKSWQNGVKDKMESKKLLSLPFNPRDVASFVFGHDPWFPGALPGLYFALAHEFGREEVDKVLSS